MAKVSKHVKDEVWKKYMRNKMEGKCYCCGIETITFFNFEVGHNIAKANQGPNDIENLRPICRGCNASMRTESIESFRAKHFASTTRKQAAGKRKKKSPSNEIDKFDKWLGYG